MSFDDESEKDQDLLPVTDDVAEEAAVDLGMQRLDAPVEDLGRARKRRHLSHRYFGARKRRRGATRRQNLEAELDKYLAQLDDSPLLRYRNQCAANHAAR